MHGDPFAVRYSYDIPEKKTGKRSRDSEIAVYTVRNARIVEEQFFARQKEG